MNAIRTGAFDLHRLGLPDPASAFTEDSITVIVRRAREQRQQALAKVVVAGIDARQVIDGGGEIEEFDERITDPRRDRHTGRGLDQKRYATGQSSNVFCVFSTSP